MHFKIGPLISICMVAASGTSLAAPPRASAVPDACAPGPVREEPGVVAPDEAPETTPSQEPHPERQWIDDRAYFPA